MQKLAKELGVVIPVSFFEEANNAHYNSIAIIDADGTDLGIYRKSHIPDGPGMQYSGPYCHLVCGIITNQIISPTGYEEKFYFNPGDTGFKVSVRIALSEMTFVLWFFFMNGGCCVTLMLLLNRFSKLSLQKLELVRTC